MPNIMLEIHPTDHIGGIITAPPSKSASHRALIAAALADGISRLQNVLNAEDIQVTIDALRAFGVSIEQDKDTTVVHGTGGHLLAPSTPIQLGNSGTSMRFLMALAAIAKGTTSFDGSVRLRERPVHDLLKALNELGIKTSSKSGFLPLSIQGEKIAGGTVHINPEVSSQFVSAIMFIASSAKKDIEIIMDGSPVSESYIALTAQVMNDFGIASKRKYNHILIPHNQHYKPRNLNIEGDFSSASYFFGLTVITGKTITVKGLRDDSKQGDKELLDILVRTGCEVSVKKNHITVTGSQRLVGIDVDMHTMPDVVPTLAVVALHAKTPTTIRNVAHLRHKECDRLHVLTTELRKTGARIEERDDGLSVFPLLKPQRAILNSYNDHRMAMSFALLGVKIPGIRILQPDTSKSYPAFFNDLEKVGMRVVRKNVVLTGFRGTGKTAIGQSLAGKMSVHFIDLDSEIEKESGSSVSAIVEHLGWKKFRDLESGVCKKVALRKPAVIATGGGTMMNEDTARLLEKENIIVLLTADSGTIRKRIAGSSRPSLTGHGTLREIEQLLKDRDAAYRKHADITIDTSPEGSVEEKSELIMSRISQL